MSGNSIPPEFLQLYSQPFAYPQPQVGLPYRLTDLRIMPPMSAVGVPPLTAYRSMLPILHANPSIPPTSRIARQSGVMSSPPLPSREMRHLPTGRRSDPIDVDEQSAVEADVIFTGIPVERGEDRKVNALRNLRTSFTRARNVDDLSTKGSYYCSALSQINIELQPDTVSIFQYKLMHYKAQILLDIFENSNLYKYISLYLQRSNYKSIEEVEKLVTEIEKCSASLLETNPFLASSHGKEIPELKRRIETLKTAEILTLISTQPPEPLGGEESSVSLEKAAPLKRGELSAEVQGTKISLKRNRDSDDSDGGEVQPAQKKGKL